MTSSTVRNLALAAAAAVAVYFVAVHPRLRAERALDDRAAAAARVRVRTVLAEPGSAATELVLPANLQPFADTAIYARTSGYVAKWLVDLGDKVKAGQTMAVIDSPEVDQELNQARANLAQAKANLELARISADRWKSLAQKNAVAQQDVDTRLADFAARQADVSAAEANVQRLEQLKGFETVTAPFSGTVSARNVDVGNLVGPNGGPELFHLSQSGTLRVFADVPQADVGAIRVGLPVEIVVPELANGRFRGKITRFSGALDAASRTLRTEIEIPNPEGRLVAGMYGELQLQIPASTSTLIIPSNDVIVRAEGTLVAEVTAQGTIHLQPVRLGRDFGTQIEILGGLTRGSRLVENPSDALAEGTEVDY